MSDSLYVVSVCERSYVLWPFWTAMPTPIMFVRGISLMLASFHLANLFGRYCEKNSPWISILAFCFYFITAGNNKFLYVLNHHYWIKTCTFGYRTSSKTSLNLGLFLWCKFCRHVNELAFLLVYFSSYSFLVTFSLKNI